MSCLFTANQIAVALGRKRQVIQRLLLDAPPSGQLLVKGNLANAWTVESLPAGLLEPLQAEAKRRNYRTAGDLLANPPTRWKPSIPLVQIAQHCVDKALKLKSALAGSIKRQDDLGLSQAKFEALGVEDYKKVFGHSISTRHFRDLFRRTVERDGGAEDWERTEIYLDQDLAKKVDDFAAVNSDAYNEFAPLLDIVRSFKSVANPTHEDRVCLWKTAFELFDELLAEGKPEQKTQKRLLRFLWENAQFLAKTANALRVCFKRKYRELEEKEGSIEAIIDGRLDKKGLASKPEIPQQDKDLIASYAAFKCGGRVRQAIKEMANLGDRSRLSKETLDLLRPDSENIYYSNQRVVESVKYDVEMVLPYMLGDQALDDATAFLERDYSKLRSMHIVCADDFTMPVYFSVPDGEGWHFMTRGQVLLFIDVRSLKIIHWCFIPDKVYDGLRIKTSMNVICRTLGIPKKWHFEKGIWQRAKIIKGPPKGWMDAHSWNEIEVGWEQIGVKFMHSIRARSKPAERVGGLLQDLMEGEPGYCGRDERRDCPQITREKLASVAARHIHPDDYFYDFGKWDARLAGLIEKYNAKPQGGKILNGLSPNEAFEKLWPRDNPPKRIDASCWHLVAHYVKTDVMGTNGISFQFGKKKYRYFNEATGRDRFKTVKAWFDPECPEFICVTDMDGKNPYLVERVADVDYDADPNDPIYESGMEKVAGHSKYAKARFHTLKATFEANFRLNITDKKTATLASQMRELRENHHKEQKQEQSIQNQVRKQARNQGLPASILNPRSTEAANGLDLMAQARRAHQRQEAATETTQESQDE